MSKTEYSISIQELIERPEIRNDYEGNMKWLNKMTDEEIDQFNEEAYAMCIEEGTPDKFPDLNAAHMAKTIDRGILYDLFLMG